MSDHDTSRDADFAWPRRAGFLIDSPSSLRRMTCWCWDTSPPYCVVNPALLFRLSPSSAPRGVHIGTRTARSVMVRKCTSLRAALYTCGLHEKLASCLRQADTCCIWCAIIWKLATGAECVGGNIRKSQDYFFSLFHRFSSLISHNKW